MAQLESQISDISDKIDDIRENISGGSSSNVKLKKKKEIVCLLKEEGRITTSELSDIIDLSRTRCSEYLNEMKKEGILKGSKEGRKKYYELDI